MDEESIERVETTLNSEFLLRKFRVNQRVLDEIKKVVFVDEHRRIKLPITRAINLSDLNTDKVLDRARLVFGFLRLASSPEEGYMAMKAVLTFLEYWMGFRVEGEENVRKLCEIANQVYPGKVVLDCEAMTYEEFKMRRANGKQGEKVAESRAGKLGQVEENLMYL